jgi:Tol biopolymer transport system component
MHSGAGVLAGAIGIALSVPAVRGDVMMTIRQKDRWRSAGRAAASVSGDGRYVAFTSYARLSAADTNEHADIYVLDRVTGAVTLESLTADGEPLIGDSDAPRLNHDGRLLVFQTTVEDSAGRFGADVVLRDRSTGVSHWIGKRVSADHQWNSDPTISDDGRVVAFRSTATNLVEGVDLNGVREDVYAFDVASETIRRVSVDGDGRQHVEGSSYGPSVSGDGRYIAFVSTADLDSPDTSNAQRADYGLAQVFLRDTVAGTTTRVSVGPTGPLDGPSYEPAISGDGRFIAFTSRATNLAHRDRNGAADVFVRDMRAGTTELISRNANGRTANGSSGHPAISADGRFVAFQSEASDLICTSRCQPSLEDVNLLPDVFLFDRTNAHATWISAWPNAGWAEESEAPQIDADGTVVAFTSRHPIDERDTAHDFDLFVRIRK